MLLWFANQQHLYYGSFVLAVPIFCMVIEFMGVVTKKYRTTNEAAAPPAMNGQRRAGRTVSEDMFKFGGDLVSGFAFGGDKTQPTISSCSAPKGTRRTSRRKPWLERF